MPKLTKRTPSPTELDRLIRNRIAESSDPCLPSLARLCAEYHVGRDRIRSVLHRLCDEGLIEYGRGRRACVAGRRAMPPETRVAAHLLAAREIRRRIERAELRVGQDLPKVGLLAGELDTSPRSVVAALALLESEKAVHRRGRRWVVGSPGTPMVIGGNPRTAPVILILVPSLNSWEGLLSPRTGDFFRSFAAEASAWGVQLLSLYGKGRDRGGRLERQAAAKIDELGGRYWGTVIAGGHGEIGDVHRIVRRLLPAGRPVVWFDRYDEGLEQPIRNKQFVCCRHAERAAVAAAVQHLASLGHRKVAYVQIHQRGWQAERYEHLLDAARACPNPIEITRPSRFPIDELRANPALQPLTLRRLHRRGPRHVRGMIDDMIRKIEGVHAPDLSTIDDPYRGINEGRRYLQNEAMLLLAAFLTEAMVELTTDTSITALIAPQDRVALRIRTWLDRARIAVPQRFSLLSFDNYDRMLGEPIDAVDFGFGPLGYKAFHALMGDVPVGRDEQGTVSAEPRIALRGSTGEAPTAR